MKKKNTYFLSFFFFLILFSFPAFAEEEIVLPGHTGTVNGIDVNKDGKFVVSGSNDKSIRVWESKTNKERLILENAHLAAIRTVKYSPAGNVIASGGEDYKIKLWRADKGTLVRNLGNHFGSVNDLDFHPDGRWLASAGSDQKIKIWDIQRGNVLNTFIGHQGEVFAICFNRKGNILASAGEDKTIRIWEVPSGRLLKTFAISHRNPVQYLQFSPDDKKIVSSGWQEVILWDVEKSTIIRVVSGQDVSAVAFSRSGKTLAVGGGHLKKTIKLWNITDGKTIAELEGSEGAISSLVFMPDDKILVSGGDDYQVRFWDLETKKQLFVD